MGSRRETLGFGLVLAICLAGFFHDTLLGDRILSPADVLLVEASFRDQAAGEYEPFNRLLMDPVLQFQPWLEFNRSMLRQGRLPLWNPYAGCGAPHLANGQSAVFDPFHLLAYVGTVPRALGWMAAGRLWVAGLGMFLLARRWGAGGWGRWFAGLVYPFCGFLIVWLLYPVTPVAIWLPWLLLTSDRVIHDPRARRAGELAIVVGLILVGGHVQTGAHVLLAGGLFALWRVATTTSILARSRPEPAGLDGGNRPGPDAGGRADHPAGSLPGAEPGLGRSPARDESLVDPGAAAAPRRRLHGAALCLWQPAAGPSQPGARPGRAQPQRVGRRIRGAGHPDLAGPPGSSRSRTEARGSVSCRSWSSPVRWARFVFPPWTTCSEPFRCST